LLHALPLDHRMWEPQHEVLAGHDVIAPDLYGLGGTMDEWAESLLGLVDGEFAAGGGSLGGSLALPAGRAAPARRRGIVLSGSGAAADAPERRAVRAEMIEVARARGAVGLWEEMGSRALPPEADPGLVERVRALALEQDPDDLIRAIEVIRDRSDAR